MVFHPFSNDCPRFLHQVACLARCNGAHVEAYRAEEPDVTLEAFRDAVRAACEGDTFQAPPRN